MTMVLNQKDIKFLQKRQRDDTGRIFSWNDRIFRGIFPKKEDHVKSMFSSGFLTELISQNCFPETWLTDYNMEGFSMIIEHKKIWPVIYPQEWTFSMLRDAALLVCRTALIAKRYGYNMRDCHGLNVLFDGVTPKFIDLGSFVTDTYMGWKPYEEFLRFYYYPLRIWQHNNFLGKLSIFSGNLTPHENYWKYQHPFFRHINPNFLRRLIGWYLRPSMLVSNSFLDTESLVGINKYLYKLIKKRVISPASADLERLVRKINSISPIKTLSYWHSYHEDIKEKAGRFGRIIEIINSFGEDVRTAVDFGGNQGKFSKQLLQLTGISEVVCVDSDESAVESGYLKENRGNKGKITFAHYDFMGGIVKLRFMAPNDRFRADLAVALALTHHLTLAQGYDIEDVFRYISGYAKKYVLIEFMPLGLWVKGRQPSTPDWYTADWFREAFTKYFDLVLEEKLRENNTIFAGKVRKGSEENSANV